MQLELGVKQGSDKRQIKRKIRFALIGNNRLYYPGYHVEGLVRNISKGVGWWKEKEGVSEIRR